jgi:hypothetical protein
MKIQRNKPPFDRGSALVVKLLTSAILTGMVGSYFCLTQSQCLSVVRSQSLNQALVVAEGGVDEAMGLLNSGVQAPNFAIFPWTARVRVFQNDTNRPASKFGDSYYEVVITNAFRAPTRDLRAATFPGRSVAGPHPHDPGRSPTATHLPGQRADDRDGKL